MNHTTVVAGLVIRWHLFFFDNTDATTRVALLQFPCGAQTQDTCTYQQKIIIRHKPSPELIRTDTAHTAVNKLHESEGCLLKALQRKIQALCQRPPSTLASPVSRVLPVRTRPSTSANSKLPSSKCKTVASPGLPGTKDPSSGRPMAAAGPLVLAAMTSFKETPSARNFDSVLS